MIPLVRPLIAKKNYETAKGCESMKSIDILIQDQSFSESFSLHEALLYACQDADEGSAAFAFVTAAGAKLYLEDQLFLNMIGRGQFKLIVGLDAITDPAALSKLGQLESDYSNLEVLAFLNDTPNSIFHPKCTWFKNSDGGTVVVGSGNLTVGGLRRNREVFAVLEVSIDEINKLQDQWNRWLSESSSLLYPVDDPAVLERAAQNRRLRTFVRSAVQESGTNTEITATTAYEIDDDATDWSYADNSEVLLAELPKGGSRWNQAGFSKETFITFFGATPGNISHRILLRQVKDDQSLSEIENRPSVTVKSKNYRFELAAASHLPYPDVGKPIVVFVKISTRMFLYMLVMPGHAQHEALDTWLQENWEGGSRPMKQIVRPSSQVHNLLSDLGIAKYQHISQQANVDGPDAH